MRIVPLIGITALALAAPRPGRAQVHFGPQLSWASQSIGVGVGARVEASLARMIPSMKGLGVIGSFDYFFPGGSNGVTPKYWEINLNGDYHIAIPNSKIGPYAGAGLVAAHSSVSVCVGAACANGSTTNVGLNLLAGVDFPPMGKITPFAELRLELRTGSAFVVSGGVLF
jgi:opacity protein-like surface antigen